MRKRKPKVGSVTEVEKSVGTLTLHFHSVLSTSPFANALSETPSILNIQSAFREEDEVGFVDPIDLLFFLPISFFFKSHVIISSGWTAYMLTLIPAALSHRSKFKC